MTDEQSFIEQRLCEIGVEMATRRTLVAVEANAVVFEHLGTSERHHFDTLVLVTGRLPETGMHEALIARDWQGAGIRSLTPIGDCLAPSSIADAVFSGHRFARLLDSAGPEVVGRERPLAFTGPTGS